MSLFNINLDRAADMQTPEELRSGLSAFVKAILSGFKAILQRFHANRTANLYQANHSSQVVYMEAVLNDAFDYALRRIRIVDTADIDSTYIYLRNEAKPRFVSLRSEAQPLTIWLHTETSLLGPDFVVKVPVGLVYDVVRLKALVNDYRLASKSDFLIKTV